MRQRRSAAGAKSLEALPTREPEYLPETGLPRREEVEVSRARGFRVEFVRREGARRMVDVGPTLRLWAEDGGAPDVARALVRLRPPAGVSPERVERLRASCVAAGAVAVKVIPPAAGPAVAPREVEAPSARGIRQTVEACAAAARTRDRKRLDGVLEAALMAEGL